MGQPSNMTLRELKTRPFGLAKAATDRRSAWPGASDDLEEPVGVRPATPPRPSSLHILYGPLIRFARRAPTLPSTRIMRRLVLISVLLLALAPTADAQLSRGLLGTDGVQLEDGRGFATVVSREGAILGSVGRGRVTIRDFPRGERTSIQVWGCERRRRLGPRTRLCIGRDIRFVVSYGAWRVAMKGRDIDASAVVDGTLTLRGTAGTFSLEGDDPRRWPRSAETFELG